MFKWLKTKISNLYNRYKAWKQRHPVLTATVAIGVVIYATVRTIAFLAVGTLEPTLLPFGVALFAAYCIWRTIITYATWRMEIMNMAKFDKAQLRIA